MLNLGRCPAPVLIRPQVPPELLHFIGFNFPGKHIPVYKQICASAQLELGLVPIFVCEPSQTFNNHPKKQIRSEPGEFYWCLDQEIQPSKAAVRELQDLHSNNLEEEGKRKLRKKNH